MATVLQNILDMLNARPDAKIKFTSLKEQPNWDGNIDEAKTAPFFLAHLLAAQTLLNMSREDRHRHVKPNMNATNLLLLQCPLACQVGQGQIHERWLSAFQATVEMFEAEGRIDRIYRLTNQLMLAAVQGADESEDAAG